MSVYSPPNHRHTVSAYGSMEQVHTAEPLIHWASRMAGYASLAGALILGLVLIF